MNINRLSFSVKIRLFSDTQCEEHEDSEPVMDVTISPER